MPAPRKGPFAAQDHFHAFGVGRHRAVSVCRGTLPAKLTAQWSLSNGTTMAASITALEAKTRFGQLLDRVSRGEEVIVTRHDKPVARIVPVGRPAREEVRAAVAGLRELRRAIAMRSKDQPALTAAEVRSMIEEGRR